MRLEIIYANILKAIKHYMTAPKLDVDEPTASAERDRLIGKFAAYEGSNDDSKIDSLIKATQDLIGELKKSSDAKKYEKLCEGFEKIIKAFVTPASLNTTSMLTPKIPNLNMSMAFSKTPSLPQFEHKQSAPQRMFSTTNTNNNRTTALRGYAGSIMSTVSHQSVSSTASFAVMGSVNNLKQAMKSTSAVEDKLQEVIGAGRVALVRVCKEAAREVAMDTEAAPDDKAQAFLATVEAMAIALLIRVDVEVIDIFQYYNHADGQTSNLHKEFFKNFSAEAKKIEKTYPDKVTDPLSSRETKSVIANATQGKLMIFKKSDEYLKKVKDIEFNSQDSNTMSATK